MSVHAQGLALMADRQMIKNYEETGLYESNIERKSREEKQLKRTKRLGSTKKHYVSLLGDSIIDNKVYVGEGELSVTEHLQHKSSSNFSMIAVDGDTTEEVLDNQLDILKNPVSHIVLSIGGNDLMQLTLGVDRDSEHIAYLNDDKNISFRRMIKMTIELWLRKIRR